MHKHKETTNHKLCQKSQVIYFSSFLFFPEKKNMYKAIVGLVPRGRDVIEMESGNKRVVNKR